MKFSIVIPVYNVERYVAACIDSVLKQSHQDIEVIMVDDGSTDRSGVICDQYAERHPDKVKVFHRINQGPHMARMQGIEHVSGDAVLFVDADDVLRGDALEQLGVCFEETECDMVLFNASREENFSTAFVDFPFEDGHCFFGETKKTLYNELILNSNMNSLCLKTVRRELLAAIPQECRDFSGWHAEDLWLVMPLLTSARKIIFINQILYYYRSRPESIVHSYNPERHCSIKKVHLEMEKYIDEWQMEALHPAHYCREVRGWVECLKMIMRQADRNRKVLFRELAEDDYFRKAYQNMDGSALSKKDAFLASLLYKKRFVMLNAVTFVANTAGNKGER